jgi:hypothetical protein
MKSRDRQKLLDELATAENHVALGDIRLERKRASIEERSRDGFDVKEAKRLLQNMERTQQTHLKHLALIRKEVAELGPQALLAAAQLIPH